MENRNNFNEMYNVDDANHQSTFGIENNMNFSGECMGVVHEVKAGDTLYSISKKYNVPLSMIMRANRNANVYNLQIGSLVCIPGRTMSDNNIGINQPQGPGPVVIKPVVKDVIIKPKTKEEEKEKPNMYSKEIVIAPVIQNVKAENNKSCPVCPEQKSCPVCEKPTPVVCPEQKPCPVCKECPKQQPCPKCKECPEQQPCPICKECPKQKPCPVCKECPEQQPCPVCKEEKIKKDIVVVIPEQIKIPCQKCKKNGMYSDEDKAKDSKSESCIGTNKCQTVSQYLKDASERDKKENINYSSYGYKRYNNYYSNMYVQTKPEYDMGMNCKKMKQYNQHCTANKTYGPMECNNKGSSNEWNNCRKNSMCMRNNEEINCRRNNSCMRNDTETNCYRNSGMNRCRMRNCTGNCTNRVSYHDFPQMTAHVVVENETMKDICNNYQMTVEEVLYYNHVEQMQLYPGKVILVRKGNR